MQLGKRKQSAYPKLKTFNYARRSCPSHAKYVHRKPTLKAKINYLGHPCQNAVLKVIKKG